MVISIQETRPGKTVYFPSRERGGGRHPAPRPTYGFWFSCPHCCKRTRLTGYVANLGATLDGIEEHIAECSGGAA